LRHILLRRTILRRTLRLSATTLLPLRTAIAAAFALRLLPALGTGRPRATGTSFGFLSSPLLELLDLPLHVLADRAVLAGAHLVETTERAAFPTFGVGLPAGAAQDAFWQRHCRAGRIVHFRQWSPGTTPRVAKHCRR
jgi:hypothetical protein